MFLRCHVSLPESIIIRDPLRWTCEMFNQLCMAEVEEPPGKREDFSGNLTYCTSPALGIQSPSENGNGT